MAAKKREEIMSDESIIDLYFARDEDAIFETDKKYGNYLMTVAMNILKNDFDSRTCLNDTYLRAWTSIPPTRPRMLKAFLAKIMRGRRIFSTAVSMVSAQVCSSGVTRSTKIRTTSPSGTLYRPNANDRRNSTTKSNMEMRIILRFFIARLLKNSL